VNKATIIRLYAERLHLVERNGSGSHRANKDYAFDTVVSILMETESLYTRYALWLYQIGERC